MPRNSVLASAVVRRRAAPVLMAALLATASCSDSVSPGEEFDPARATATAQAIAASMAGNRALQSLGVLGGAVSFAPRAEALLGATLPGGPAALRAWIGSWLARPAGGAALTATEPAVIIPGDILGSTLIYNADTRRYEIDPARTGAPQNGVRFVLYAVDPIRGEVLTPPGDHEIGYLDLRDESTPAADILGITAVIGNEVVLDYQARATFELLNPRITFLAEGFVAGEGDVVNFSLRQSFSQASGVELDYQVEAGEGTASVRLQVSATPDETATITLTVSDGTDVVVLRVSGTEERIEGSVTFNGAIVVLISGPPDDPQFTNADGEPLSNEEVAALADLVAFVGDLFAAFQNLLGPAHSLLGIPAFAL
jgi:hypothetical protein